MSMSPIFNFFFEPYYSRSPYLIILESIAFFSGITSVIYAKKENTLVYPIGLIATTITVFILFKDKLIGDMMINFYYSIMSIYGWWNWSRKKENQNIVPISRTNPKEKQIGCVLFLSTMIITYVIYRAFNAEISTSNYIDIFTSGIFFTAMWYMANKKIENWTLWIFANTISVPLYASRGWGMFALQYLIFTILAIQGYIAWKKNINKNLQTVSK